MLKISKRKSILFGFICLICITPFMFLVSAEKVTAVEYSTSVTLTTIEVYEDNDDGLKGEIYCESMINDHSYTTSIKEEVDNGDIVVYNEILYVGWCDVLSILIEVWDDDNEPIPVDNEPDSLGAVNEYLSPINDTKSFITYDYEDQRNEANVTILIQTAGIRTVTMDYPTPIITLVMVFGMICVSTFYRRDKKSK